MNLNIISLMDESTAKTFLKDAVSSNKKVFVYFQPLYDHNNNIKKELLLSVDPSYVRPNQYGIREVSIYKANILDGIRYINDNILPLLPTTAISTILREYPKSREDRDNLHFINTYFHMFLLTYDQVKDYIEEMKEEQKKIASSIDYLISNL